MSVSLFHHISRYYYAFCLFSHDYFDESFIALLNNTPPPPWFVIARPSCMCFVPGHTPLHAWLLKKPCFLHIA